MALTLSLLFATAGCMLSPQPDPPGALDAADGRGDDLGGAADTGGDGPEVPEHDAPEADPGDTWEGEDGAGGDAVDACDRADPQPPATPEVFWDPRLTGTGEATLGGHGHDDGLGPVGYCPCGEGSPRYVLISAVFQSDEGNESGGNHKIYVDVYGGPAERLLGVGVVVSNGVEEWTVPTEDRPLPEATMNFPMWGGNVYSVHIEGTSDEVFNLRMPNNHHVNFVLAFRREGAP